MKSLILVFILGTAVQRALSEEEPTCMCFQTPENCGCQCYEPISEEYFKSLSEQFAPCDDFAFRLMGGGEYESFPSEFFWKVGRVKHFTLDVSNVVFRNFLDPTPLASPFKGVSFEESATINLRNVTVKEGWNWGAMADLTSKKGEATVRIRYTPIHQLTDDFSMILGSRVTQLSISDVGIQSLGDMAFYYFRDLSDVLLIDNNLGTVKRSQFPNPAPALLELNLARNNLREIPKGFFEGMPALKNVYLGENPITTMDEETFRPIIGQAMIWGVGDFPLHCDCNVKWLKDSSISMYFQDAKCKTPAKLEDKKLIDEVLEEDLVC